MDLIFLKLHYIILPLRVVFKNIIIKFRVVLRGAWKCTKLQSNYCWVEYNVTFLVFFFLKKMHKAIIHKINWSMFYTSVCIS
jgi:hypothetical protein